MGVGSLRQCQGGAAAGDDGVVENTVDRGGGGEGLWREMGEELSGVNGYKM